MPIELKIPEIGESITEVQIAEWLKSEGDAVTADENVAVIDSEKTTFELPAPKGGRLAKILHKAGDTVKVGETIARIDPDGQSCKEEPAGEKDEEKREPRHSESRAAHGEKKPPQKRDAHEEVPADLGGAEPEQQRAAVKETERQRRQMERTPDKTQKEPPPSGEAAIEEPPARPGEDEEVVPMTMLRRTVARRLVEAHQTMAMLTTFNEVDMSAVQTLRREHAEKFEKRHKVKLGLMSFFVKAAIDALKQFPGLNAEIRDTDVVYRNYFDIGVAIATDRGLVVPVLRRAERMSFAELEKTIGDFALRARDYKLKPDDLEGGTFTITNGGVFGSLLSTPIVNPPQTGILGMHAIQERPVVVEGQVAIHPMMYLALTYDHRLVDGREAVLFLRRVKEAIESPARMLIEI